MSVSTLAVEAVRSRRRGRRAGRHCRAPRCRRCADGTAAPPVLGLRRRSAGASASGRSTVGGSIRREMSGWSLESVEASSEASTRAASSRAGRKEAAVVSGSEGRARRAGLRGAGRRCPAARSRRRRRSSRRSAGTSGASSSSSASPLRAKPRTSLTSASSPLVGVGVHQQVRAGLALVAVGRQRRGDGGLGRGLTEQRADLHEATVGLLQQRAALGGVVGGQVGASGLEATLDRVERLAGQGLLGSGRHPGGAAGHDERGRGDDETAFAAGARAGAAARGGPRSGRRPRSRRPRRAAVRAAAR